MDSESDEKNFFCIFVGIEHFLSGMVGTKVFGNGFRYVTYNKIYKISKYFFPEEFNYFKLEYLY